MKPTCIIVEDEPLAAERLKDYAHRLGGLEVLAHLEDAESAVAMLQKCTPDLLFLDIHLLGMTGLELLERIQPACPVILTTAFPQYALRGYDLQVADYLLKPYTEARFLQAVQRGLLLRQRGPQHLFVKSGTTLERVHFEEILFIEGMRDYRRIHTTTKRIMTLVTFQELEQRLPAERFLRIHKSWMVHLDKVIRMEGDEVWVGNTALPVSETYKAKVKAMVSGRPARP